VSTDQILYLNKKEVLSSKPAPAQIGVPVSQCSKSNANTKHPRLTSNMLTLQVFENGALLVVVSFDAAVAEQEGDLTGYMNELARLNSVPGSWQLCKSTANWGQVQVHATHKSPVLFCDSCY